LGLQAAKQATASIPIIVAGVDDAVEQGFVDSFAKPGGNITGVSWLNSELSAKRLQLLQEAVASGSQMAFLREGAGGVTQLRATEAAARTLGIQLQIMEVLDRSWLPNTFRQMKQDGVRAVVVADSPMFNAEQERIAELAVANQLLTIFPSSTFVRAGGLMSYGPSLADVYARAADYADRVLKGGEPKDLPVEQPTKVEMVINLKTAKALNLAIPPLLYARATELIE
jgi:putative ABC transport system substrate-binding protein